MQKTTDHVKYLQPWGRGKAVEVKCTCGQSHGVQTYRSFEQAMETGRFDGYVRSWVANNQVTRICRNYAEKGTGVEGLRQTLSLKM